MPDGAFDCWLPCFSNLISSCEPYASDLAPVVGFLFGDDCPVPFLDKAILEPVYPASEAFSDVGLLFIGEVSFRAGEVSLRLIGAFLFVN